MKIVVAKEHLQSEGRVILTPEGVKKLIASGFQVVIQKGAGERAGFSDEAYEEARGVIEGDEQKLYHSASISLRINPLTKQDVAYLPPHSIVLGLLKPHLHPEELKELASERVTSLSLELIPRITRAQSMDVLSSQSNLAGYRAVIEGAYHLKSAFPMMITAAGTIAPARVLVLGAGVAGLQAIATAKRLGALISAYDVRPEVKEQVESLGAIFVSVEKEAFKTESGESAGGYAKEMSASYQEAQKQKLMDVIKNQDLVITTAQIPMKKAPILIEEDMVNVMKNGSMIIDLSSETGGNCALTRHGEMIQHKGVDIYGPENILSAIAFNASQLLSRNVVHFILNMMKDDKINVEDEIVKATCLTYEGTIVHPYFATKES